MQTQMTSLDPRQAPPLLPPVDISEDSSAITIAADMPGVEKSAVSINVDGRTLTVEAPLALGEANALVSVYAEIKANQYRRVFELSGELDSTSIDAGLVDGVLTLRIPKLERAKPRRIEVKAG
ncbi:MAG: Hsp20/alpha crystallin family protein [Pseudomonadota bacterium]|nr:Hsp20/alpha crystallin family protein [Pseudomonadota bacterium]